MAKNRVYGGNWFLPERPIAFNREFIRLGLSVNAALFLSQACYWTPRTRDEDGWFYKTTNDWEEETGLTIGEQRSVKKILLSKGLIEIKLEGLPAKNYYRVRAEAISKALEENTKMCELNTTSCVNLTQLDVLNSHNILYTENTTESTTYLVQEREKEPVLMVEAPMKAPRNATPKKAFEYSPEFEVFWSIYPKRQGKGAAYESWKKIAPSQELQAKILNAVNAHNSRDPQWKQEGGKYIPMPSTFLNQRRWDDDIVTTGAEYQRKAQPLKYKMIIAK